MKRVLYYWNSYVTSVWDVFLKEKQARVAQSVERVAFNHNVQGSSPCSGDYFFYFLKLFYLKKTYEKKTTTYILDSR